LGKEYRSFSSSYHDSLCTNSTSMYSNYTHNIQVSLWSNSMNFTGLSPVVHQLLLKNW
jgi:hypothetical protein